MAHKKKTTAQRLLELSEWHLKYAKWYKDNREALQTLDEGTNPHLPPPPPPPGDDIDDDGE